MKDYYADFLQNKISVNTLPTVVSKVSKGFVETGKQAFDTFDTTLPGTYQKNNRITQGNCSLCTAELKAEPSDVLIVRFCPFGCAFTEARFTDDFAAIDAATSKLFEAMTFDELQALGDAVDERAAILMCDYDLNNETAMSEAVQIILPNILDKHLPRLARAA